MEESKELTVKKLPESYDIYLKGDIDDLMLRDFQKEVNEKLLEIQDIIMNIINMFNECGIEIKQESVQLPIFNIYLTTYGGSVYDGLGIYDIIKELEQNGYKTNIYCSGYVMSMGIPIMLASSNRISYKHTTFMIHELWSIGVGKVTELKENYEECERLNKIIKDIIMSNTSITEKELDDWFTHKKDKYISPERAKEIGLIHDIIS